MIIKYISFLVGVIWSYSIIKTQSIFSKKTGLLFKLFISKVSWFTLIAACYFGYKNFSIKFTIIGIVLSVLIVQFSFSFIKKNYLKYLMKKSLINLSLFLNTLYYFDFIFYFILIVLLTYFLFLELVILHNHLYVDHQ